MRRFRFVGDPEESWLKDLITGEVYPNDYFLTNGGTLISDSRPKECWQEVFDEPKPLHKDTDLGYFAGLAMQGIMANPSDVIQALTDPQKAQYALIMAENLIKQLNEETK